MANAPPSPPPGLQQPPPLHSDTTSEDIFATFHLSGEDSKKLELVKKKFDEYFIKKTNVVYESACFHKRHQMPGESIDQFTTVLHILAEKCDFREFKQRLIRDPLSLACGTKNFPSHSKCTRSYLSRQL
ncbi:hypothetical protein MRX96_008124 [Rhipicephalus microplus]